MGAFMPFPPITPCSDCEPGGGDGLAVVLLLLSGVLLIVWVILYIRHDWEE